MISDPIKASRNEKDKQITINSLQISFISEAIKITLRIDYSNTPITRKFI